MGHLERWAVVLAEGAIDQACSRLPSGEREDRILEWEREVRHVSE